MNSNPAKVRTLSQLKQTIKEEGKQKDRGGGRDIDSQVSLYESGRPTDTSAEIRHIHWELLKMKD